MRPSLLISTFLVWSTLCNASPESNLYQFDHYKLDNGLSVVLKKRTHAPSVSIRLAVEVGHRYFPCKKNESAHLLEHMLFKGTKSHSEDELDDILESNGGMWNATTDNMQTTYEIDIYSNNVDVGLNMLFEIMTESTLDYGSYLDARKAVYREGDGEQSALVHWLYKYDIGKPASDKALEWMLGAEVACQGSVNLDSIKHQHMKDIFETYYQPENMTLVIVGDFNIREVKALINNTFQILTNTETYGARNPPEKPRYHTSEKTFYGTLEPFLASDAGVEFLYRTDGYNSEDRFPLMLLKYYLSDALFNNLRTKKNLSYSPASDSTNLPDYGFISLNADANNSDIDEVKTSIKDTLNEIIANGVEEKKFNIKKNLILLAVKQGYERNSDFSDFYSSYSAEIRENGQVPNVYQLIEKVTLDDVNRVLNTYLNTDKEVVVITRPFLTYGQFYSLLIFFPLGMVGVVFVVVRRKKKKMRQEQF